MQSRIKKQTFYVYEKGEKVDQSFWQDILELLENMNTILFSRLQYIKIVGFIGLLFLFSVEIKGPQVIARTLPYLSGSIEQQLSIKPVFYDYYSFPILNTTSKFGYELKGNSYSYPLPFLEVFLRMDQITPRSQGNNGLNEIIDLNNKVVP